MPLRLEILAFLPIKVLFKTYTHINQINDNVNEFNMNIHTIISGNLLKLQEALLWTECLRIPTAQMLKS